MSEAQPRAPKKPRLDEGSTPDAPAATRKGPHISSLVSVPSGLQDLPSPAAMHASRIVALGHPDAGCCSSIFASSTRIYFSSCQLPAAGQLEQGKEGVLIPLRAQAPAARLLVPLVHRWEVQGLDALQAATGGEVTLVTVDSTGRGMRARLQWQTPAAHVDTVSSSAAAPAAAATGVSGGVSSSCSSLPQQHLEVVGQEALVSVDPNREAGWAGVALCPEHPSATVLARCFARDVTLYDGTRPVRTFHTLMQPYSVAFLPQQLGGGAGAPGQLISITEGHLVTIYDARASECGGVVTRITNATASSQPLYCQAWCSGKGGLLGVAGAERSVTVLEPRKWRPVSKWSSAGRQSLHLLSFLDGQPDYACVSGLDYEVLCARWEQQPSGAAQSTQPAPGRAVGPAPHQQAPPPAAAAAAAAAAAGEGVLADGDGEPAVKRNAEAFSFRGDSRWLGVSKARGCDLYAGWGASANLFYAQAVTA